MHVLVENDGHEVVGHVCRVRLLTSGFLEDVDLHVDQHLSTSLLEFLKQVVAVNLTQPASILQVNTSLYIFIYKYKYKEILNLK